MQESIVIENDGLYEEVEFSPERKLADISGKEIIEIIKEAGIVGMGGAGFPTHVKYMPKDPSAIDHITIKKMRQQNCGKQQRGYRILKL